MNENSNAFDINQKSTTEQRKQAVLRQTKSDSDQLLSSERTQKSRKYYLNRIYQETREIKHRTIQRCVKAVHFSTSQRDYSQAFNNRRRNSSVREIISQLHDQAMF